MLRANWDEGKFVCVGLDPDFNRIPQFIRDRTANVADVLTRFVGDIVEATHDLALAYKPNIAFYEAYGAAGLEALWITVEEIHRINPNVPVILDAKRADIGNTNAGYVLMAFGQLKVDAITVHPYLGREALMPFLNQKEKGIFVLCRTSNPGAGEFQDLQVNLEDRHFDEICQGQPVSDEHFTMDKTMPFWKYMAYRVHGVWNRKSHNCGVVVGATYPEELAVVRKIVRGMPILIPGVGTQGGSVEKAVKAGFDPDGGGMIINSSSAILFASSGEDYAEKARGATLALHQEIHQHLPQRAA